LPLIHRSDAEVAEITQRRTEVRHYCNLSPVYECDSTKYSQTSQSTNESEFGMEITKALAALRQLYGKANIEIVTRDGNRVRGVVRSMKTTQALTTPAVKVERADGELVKIPFSAIVEIVDHNPPG
jgi:multidrug efflux pump subunit AcrB